VIKSSAPQHDRSESPSRRLARALTSENILIAPGVFSAISALLARRAGAQALYFSGAGFSSSMGMPDLGVFTLSELSEAVAHITASVSVPLIVDGDTGFGSVLNVARTVKDMVRAGAAAIQLEDQATPKRCGHLDGKQLVSPEEMMRRIVAAKEASAEELIIIARTDARGVEGLNAAIERSLVYRKAGADMIFPDALESTEEFSEFAHRVQGPLMANMTEFGKTPMITATQFQQLGYKLVIFPVTAFRVMLKAVGAAFDELLRQRTQRTLLDRMMSREELYELIDYALYESTDRRIDDRVKEILSVFPKHR